MKMTVTVVMDNDETFTERITPKDRVFYSEVRARHNWPPIDQDALRAEAFLAYAAAVRTGRFRKDDGFEAFLDQVVDIETEAEEVNPTIKATTLTQ